MPSSRGTVSALIVNYRAYDELIRCLPALQSQSPIQTAEIIVVDHGSVADRANGVRRSFPEAAIVGIAANEGFAAGVNRAAAQARGEYLLLVNPDTVCEPTLVAVLKGWLDAHPQVAVVGPRIVNDDGSLQASARRFPDPTTAIAGRTTFLTRLFPRNPLTRRNLGYSFTAEPQTVDWVSGACAMVRASAFRDVGGMDADFFLYWEDADLCRRLRDAGWETMYVPTVRAVHAGGRASRYARLRALLAFHRSAYRYYRKHGGRAAALTAPAVWAGLWVRAGVKALALLVRSRP